MGDRLVVPTGRIARLAGDLQVVARELEGSDSMAGALAAACGHDRLARELEESARCWQRRREDVVAGVVNLADACDGIATAFTDADVHLAQAL